MPAADGDSALEASRRPSPRSLGLLVVVAIAALGLDQLTKAIVVDRLPPGEFVPVIGDLLGFRFVENPGAAFSLGSGATWLFAVIAIVVAVVIVVFARRIHSLAWATVLGLLLGGTLGNLVDRLVRAPGVGQGHVVDFIQIEGFPAVFNVADIAIVSSMVLFVLLTLRGVRLDGTRPARSVADTGTDVDAGTDIGTDAEGGR